MREVAAAHHRARLDGASVDRIVGWLGALIPRVMSPSSLTAAARHAGAEPLWTGRPRAYAESTLRQAADRLDAEGAWAHVAHAVRAQVEGAVAKVDGEVIAHTDMLDQPYLTKKLAHAAPIGRLGNRLLGCAYFGLTTVALPGGPTLFAHLSWHKPAAPLRDALEDLFDDEARLGWWHEHVRLHIVDRGANGDPVLRWLWSWEVPYLTIGHRGAELWRFHAPTLRNAHALPIVVRPDRRLGGDAADGPWEVIVPAQPDDPDATRGIRFRSAVAFTEAELLSLNALYKSRWPSMENELKALQSQGFGRNRTRRLELVVSRGTDGEVTRLREHEARWRGKVRELEAEPLSGKAVGRLTAAAGKVTHRAIEDDQLVAALVIAVGRLPERWGAAFACMQSAKRTIVPHPDDAVAAILGDSAEVPKALLEEAQRVVLRDGDFTRFGVVQAITLVAHQTNEDPDVRFAMERLAGDYLAATPLPT